MVLRNAQCSLVSLNFLLLSAQRASLCCATCSVILFFYIFLLAKAQRASLCCATRSAFGQG
ncbi:hypothetical protein A2U01_0073849 [Trifolium medium]|uniref:Uncharacterized protein n=1 Tax=Trifolium medium TaxID=97028 RepID=A0A392SUU9_9FABA|nr:hypothetical protein [Trifolium medium]